MLALTAPFSLTPDVLAVMFLMSVRISALFLTIPVFSSRAVPVMTKVGLAIVISVVLLPTTAPNAVVPETLGHLAIAVGKELVVGVLAGFAVSLLFASLNVAASIAGIEVGFGFSNTIDLTYSGQSTALDQLFTGMAALIFLTGNFHHPFLAGVQGLFDVMPPNAFSLYRVSQQGLVELSANMFLVALRIVLPLMGALLLTEVAMGIIARTAPQMNVFFVGLPIKIALGIIALIIMLPFVVNGIEGLLSHMSRDMALILRYR